MFGWLADLLIKTPVTGTGCSCCEGRKEQLKKMQKAILSGDLVENETDNGICAGACGCHAQQMEENSEQEEMTASYHYKL